MRMAWFGILAFSAAVGAVPGEVRADVTVQQNTSLNVASVVRMHGSTITRISADKQREDNESHCEGVMSIVCGNVQNGEIVRLDRNLTWRLEPAKKRYREQVFATPEELAAMRAKMQANLEKMRSCPAAQQKAQPIDKSKCQTSPPKIEVHKTDEHRSIAGHEVERTAATLTESCTDKDTGDVCDTVIAVDVWLTQDKLPGAGDRHAFETAYAKRLGFDDTQNLVRGQVAQYLAPYQTQIKQLTDKSSDLKGQPMKTALRVMMGGAHCSAVSKAKAGDADASASNGANPMVNVAQAGKVLGASVGNLMGGLFKKKKADDSATAPDAANGATSSSTQPTGVAPAATALAAPDPYAQYVQLATFSTETVTINTDAVPTTIFDVPADWTKETPTPAKSSDADYTCPKT